MPVESKIIKKVKIEKQAAVPGFADL